MKKHILTRFLKIWVWVGLVFVGWILLQYSVGNNDKRMRSLIVETESLSFDNPTFASQGNNRFVVIKLSDQMITTLRNPDYGLWNDRSVIPDNLPFFVAQAIGTINNCPLIIVKPGILKESCSHAYYDFFGRAIKGDQFKFDNLYLPVQTRLIGQNQIEITF